MKRIEINYFSYEFFNQFSGDEVVITPTHVLFWKPPNPFGQWTYSPFEVDGINYNCAEQYMMAFKARLFGDISTEKRILESSNPKMQKQFGKLVAGFKEDIWIEFRQKIVFQGNLSKFTQNSSLRDCLMKTGNRHLVEASPFDKIWGIGFAANQPEAYDSTKWKGLNLLGEILMDVRKFFYKSTI